jgi:putative transposase
MKSRESLYRRHRFPPEIIQYAVSLYYRLNISHRDIEDLLARRGVLVTQESIRLCCNKFGPQYAHRLRRRHRGYGDTVLMGEVFVRIRGQQRYLWRAVDQDGEVVDVLPQEWRDSASARRLSEGLGRARRYVLEDLRKAAVLVGPELAAAHTRPGKHTMRCDVLRSGGRQHIANAVLVHAVLDKTP